MIVGLVIVGTGRDSGSTRYVVDEKHPGLENKPPEVIRGNLYHTRELIDTLEFRHKYTSGALSFALGENIRPKMGQAIMERFERWCLQG